MSTQVWTGRVDAIEFLSLTAEEGGWEPLAGDPRARVHTFCESEGMWTGLGCVEPSTFSYTNHGPGLLQILEGEATLTVEATHSSSALVTSSCSPPASNRPGKSKLSCASSLSPTRPASKLADMRSGMGMLPQRGELRGQAIPQAGLWRGNSPIKPQLRLRGEHQLIQRTSGE